MIVKLRVLWNVLRGRLKVGAPYWFEYIEHDCYDRAWCGGHWVLRRGQDSAYCLFRVLLIPAGTLDFNAFMHERPMPDQLQTALLGRRDVQVSKDWPEEVSRIMVDSGLELQFRTELTPGRQLPVRGNELCCLLDKLEECADNRCEPWMWRHESANRVVEEEGGAE